MLTQVFALPCAVAMRQIRPNPWGDSFGPPLREFQWGLKEAGYSCGAGSTRRQAMFRYA
jgi:hypothetical protein